MAEKPYIGVTGATTATEVQHITSTFARAELQIETSTHLPMVGILVSYKTLNGQSTANRRYPAVDTLPALFQVTEGLTFNTIHYNSRELASLADQLTQVLANGVYEDNLSRGVQLNIPWPPREQLLEAQRRFSELKIILQLSERSLEGKTPKEVAQLVKSYGDMIQYVLIDLSGGKGQEFKAPEVLPFYEELRTLIPELSIGFGGGFTGENVGIRSEELGAVIGTREFSIDAEGGLRDKITPEYGDDTYNAGRVESYVQNAVNVLEKE